MEFAAFFAALILAPFLSIYAMPGWWTWALAVLLIAVPLVATVWQVSELASTGRDLGISGRMVRAFGTPMAVAALAGAVACAVGLILQRWRVRIGWRLLAEVPVVIVAIAVMLRHLP